MWLVHDNPSRRALNLIVIEALLDLWTWHLTCNFERHVATVAAFVRLAKIRIAFRRLAQTFMKPNFPDLVAYLHFRCA